MTRRLTIIGGGLCGLGLANGLRRAGVPVTLIEAGRYPRHRVCGEFLAGLSRQTLVDLGIADCFDDALHHRTTLWFRNGKVVCSFDLPDSAPGISRHALDARMVDRLVARGGEVRTGCRVSVSPSEGTLFTAGRVVRRPGYHGLKAHFRRLPLKADLELHLGRHAYVGLSLVESGKVNVCGLFRDIARGSFASPLERFFTTLEACGFAGLAGRLSAAEVCEGSFCSISGLSYRGANPGSAACLGDQGRMIPPFTGNGMTMALQSAREVLPHAVGYAEGRLSWDHFLKLAESRLRQSFSRRITAARLMHPFLLNPLLQTALTVFTRARVAPVHTLYTLTHH